MRGLWEFWYYFSRRPISVIGLIVFVLICLCAIFAPVIARYQPLDMAGPPRLWPGDDTSLPLGTDILGRDILTDILYGAGVSLTIGIAATVASIVIGASLGAISGYNGGRIDSFLMRTTEIFQTIPSFILILILVSIFSPTLSTITLAIGVSTWPSVTRVVRAEFISLRDREYVQSCVVLGMSKTRIVLTQILPNSLAPIVTLSSVMVATAILNEASLSFLGLGDPNVMSWGTMIANGRTALRTDWYMVTIPGIAIIVTVMALNLLGDGLSDAFNPRLRGQ